MDMSPKDIAETIQAVLTSIAIVVAAYWAIRRFIYAPRIEMSVDVCFVGQHGDDWVVELLCLLENKGQVPYAIRSLSFNLRTLLESDTPAEGGDAIRHQLEFPHRVKEGSWIPVVSQNPAVIHPGIKMRYSYVQCIPADARLALLHGVLDYGKQRAQTRADRLRRVPRSEAELNTKAEADGPAVNRSGESGQS